MSGNRIGKLFSLTTFGESHGQAIGGIIDGCPPNIALCLDAIAKDIARRQTGRAHTSPRKEDDTFQLLSGMFQGKTTGTPLAFMVLNHDQRTQDYADLANCFRPGHADFTYYHKYGIRDWRGGGRASARETLTRVIAGSIAKQVLKHFSAIEIRAYLSQVGELTLPFNSWEDWAHNPYSCANQQKMPELDAYLEEIMAQKDSIGGQITVVASGMPIGLGEPVFDRLDADIAKAMMSINAVKAVSIGDGDAVITQKGSQHRDPISDNGFLSNHAGGILGGISNGADLIITLAFKPTSSIAHPIQTTDINGKTQNLSVTGRHDPCVALRAAPIAEAMLALTLCDHLLRHRAIAPQADKNPL